MGVATRDFIPAGEETPAEVAKYRRGAIIRTGANHNDFIPDPADPTVKPKVSTPQERMDRAQRAAEERMEWASRNEFRLAQLRLKDMTPSQAVATIEVMPQVSMEMYVAAEMLGAARTDIIAMFPPIAPETLARWQRELNASEEATETEPGPNPDEETPPAPVEAVAPDTAVASAVAPTSIEESFLCVECGKQAATKAGLLAHVRAKHPESA